MQLYEELCGGLPFDVNRDEYLVNRIRVINQMASRIS